ncbi:hypothetical protein OG21DRAFT_1468070 [Imleria badia]|nr:hypothetical protein OG21DRAFT_1468070 [Imleria badia]
MRLKTRPRQCTRIVSCSSRPVRHCQLRFAFRSEETSSICRASSLANGYLCYSCALLLSPSRVFFLVSSCLFSFSSSNVVCRYLSMLSEHLLDPDPDLALLFAVSFFGASAWIILSLATHLRGSFFLPGTASRGFYYFLAFFSLLNTSTYCATCRWSLMIPVGFKRRDCSDRVMMREGRNGKKR